jgi:hypothetical protein
VLLPKYQSDQHNCSYSIMKQMTLSVCHRLELKRDKLGVTLINERRLKFTVTSCLALQRRHRLAMCAPVEAPAGNVRSGRGTGRRPCPFLTHQSQEAIVVKDCITELERAGRGGDRRGQGPARGLPGARHEEGYRCFFCTGKNSEVKIERVLILR